VWTEEHSWRTFSLNNAEKWVIVGEDLEVREELDSYINRRGVFPVILAIPLIMLLVWLIIKRGLAPLARLSTEVGQRQADNLTPIAIGTLPKELHTLSHAINSLLARIQGALLREKEFTANASHEIKTPIAGILLHAQNGKLIANTPEQQQTFVAIEDGARRAGNIIEQLISLSRFEATMSASEKTSITLYALCQTLIRETGHLLIQHQHTLALHGDEKVTVVSYQPGLELIIRNLLNNAIKYTPKGGEITVDIKNNPAAIVIEDNGPGIADAEKSQVMERFYRIGGDGAKSGGSGLGLAIVRDVAALLGVAIKLEDAHGGGLRVVIVWQEIQRNP
jgi:two-component system, OmpR family, sensor histidine kinase QseC